MPSVQSFIKASTMENSFFAFRQYILDNIDLFFENKNIANIIKRISKKIVIA